MNPFECSAEFYDSLYAEKDYAAEADYVEALIRKNLPGAQSLLDLGCGTGRHAVRFAEKGYNVVGVDRSPEMISKAHDRVEQVSPVLQGRMHLVHDDIRNLRLYRRFDAVMALFHVISYQISNDDLLAAFTTANTHLREDGVFIFDCWYGPGVLTDPPVARVKQLQEGASRLRRTAEPVMHTNANLVDVMYRFVREGGPLEQPSEFCERHTMRYFFGPELALALRVTGFELVTLTEWMTDREPDRTTWSVAVVARTRQMSRHETLLK